MSTTTPFEFGTTLWNTLYMDVSDVGWISHENSSKYFKLFNIYIIANRVDRINVISIYK